MRWPCTPGCSCCWAPSGAYVVSYYFSTHTIIYGLLRRSVDGQSLTDVYATETEPPVQDKVASETPATNEVATPQDAPPAAATASEPSPPTAATPSEPSPPAEEAKPL